MLTLTRKEQEEIVLHYPSGVEVKIILVRSKSGVASIGIEAPEEVTIVRGELQDDEPHPLGQVGKGVRPCR